MKVLAVIDSFKGSLTSIDLGLIMQETLTENGIECDFIPIADGGDGFLDAIEQYMSLPTKTVRTFNSLGSLTDVPYLVDEHARTVYIEMAKCCGINFGTNYAFATTYGLGLLVKECIEAGYINFYIGLGGSNTNDGGIGFLRGLGARFYDEKGSIISPVFLHDIAKIKRLDFSMLFEKIKGVSFAAVSDVTNPLCGIEGASLVFGMQKGGSRKQMKTADESLLHFANLVNKTYGIDVVNAEGAGAAGGLGYALIGLCSARLFPGTKFILDLCNFDELIKCFDVIITGEGKIDTQSLKGKVIFEVANRAINKKIILVSAINKLHKNELTERGIFKNYYIVDNLASKDQSMQHPEFYYKQLCQEVCKDLKKL